MFRPFGVEEKGTTTAPNLVALKSGGTNARIDDYPEIAIPKLRNLAEER